jgi:zinc protease
MRHPTFPAHEVELERKLTLQSIKSQKEQPFNVAMGNLREVMYGNHPYAMSELGTEESLLNLTRDDLVQFHQQLFRPDQMVISIAGRISVDRAVALVEQVFGDWQVTTPAPTATAQSVNTKPQRIITPQPTQQSIVMLGYMAPNAPQKDDQTTAQDYMALKLLNTYLGSGLSSRLFVELREKRGLAYEVSSFYPSRLDPTHFVVYMGTAPGNTQTAYDGLKAEVDRLVNQTLSEAELQTAKDKLLGQYALGKQTNAQLANTFGWYEALGFGVEFDLAFPEQIANVTAVQAQTAAAKYFGQPYVSVLGPEEVVGKLVIAC